MRPVTAGDERLRAADDGRASEVVPRCRAERRGRRPRAGRPDGRTRSRTASTPDDVPEEHSAGLPGVPAHPRSPPSSTRCSTSGTPTAPSRRASSTRRRRERRQRVRLLRRPALRQRPPALRPPADRLRQGRRPALQDHARQARRAPLRLGHATACPPRSRRRSSSGSRTSPRSTTMGVDEFNDACRASVLAYTEEWREYVTRQARWVDFDNDYKTLDLDYMESVMWAFKTLWDKGLVYEGFRVLPYCWRCETPLSNTRPRWTTSTGRDRTRRSPSRCGCKRPDGRRRRVRPDLDDDAVDAAVQPGRRGAPGRRLRARRDATTATGRAVRPRRGPAGRTTRASWATTPRVLRRAHRRASCSAPPTRRRSTSSPAARTRTGCSPPTTSPPTTAPASCTSRRPSVRRTRSSRDAREASSPSSRSTPRASSRRGAAVRGRAGVRGEQGDHPRPRRAGPAPAAGDRSSHPYPHCWRCGTAADLQRRRRLVRQGRRSSATGWSS